eukprot:TRINITY_DN3966_c0_g1_i1.p1 TRINITY_DN3966_c0_g1~~TRINITY_DN3966_c0_g1_i1.p1  ORF type:complete len:158 (+),score=27.13 TRINITY_DN3966_c0_g1_i1:68-541(+)
MIEAHCSKTHRRYVDWELIQMDSCENCIEDANTRCELCDLTCCTTCIKKAHSHVSKRNHQLKTVDMLEMYNAQVNLLQARADLLNVLVEDSFSPSISTNDPQKNQELGNKRKAEDLQFKAKKKRKKQMSSAWQQANTMAVLSKVLLKILEKEYPDAF